MRYTISIPSPCHESWDNMTPESSGRHCEQCCKTVVDFSAWQPEDIVSYLQEQGGQRVCGRFHKDQLNTPIDADTFVIAVSNSSLPFFYKVAAILLLSFGLLYPQDSSAQPQYKVAPTLVTSDTTHHDHTMGKLKAQPHPKHKKTKKTTKSNPTGIMTGEALIVPEEHPAEHLAGLVAMHPFPPDTTKKKTK